MRSATLGATVFAVVMLLLFSPTAAVAKEADTAPTFAKDIAPIFQKNCQSCHRPNSVAPMSFMTYQEVRPWARSIKNRVVLGEMPPYRYDRHVGIQDLKDDLRLSESEIETIARWVDDGAPLGDLAEAVPDHLQRQLAVERIHDRLPHLGIVERRVAVVQPHPRHQA